MKELVIFIILMWLMIIGGGGILIAIIAPISIEHYGAFDHFLDSGIKAGIAILLVVTWIFIILRIKNWLFQKEIKH